ncbi:MAG: glycosyltransferase, partial [Candidatus Heimdallarchaeota archaeon]|nr:glycosyltransferase [Candidatus Heimdallarchaeota archaeon]
LAGILKHIIPENKKILELGCGNGKLLASLSPRIGVGIDFSSEMCVRASSLNPELYVIVADAHFIPLEEKFDYIIISDLLNDLWDVQYLFEQVKKICQKNTRIIINVYSRLWEIPLAIGQALKVAKPNLPQNWLSPLDIERLLKLENFEVIKKSQEIVFPIYLPVITPLLNRFFGKFWPFRHFSLTNVIVARSSENYSSSDSLPTVSVIIPARNEAGNIESLFTRTPELGSGTELIFVEGHSRDNTYEMINKLLDQYPGRNAKLFRQPGKGKGDAVRFGFKEASGDILMILDSALSVPPEDLTLFYNALIENKGDFINGVRLIYPMEDQAMRFLNLIGNQFFSKTFSWLLSQPIKDT